MAGITRDQLPDFGRRRRRPSVLVARALGLGLIVGGLVVGGFIAYEMWITDAIAHGAQRRLSDSLADRSDVAVPQSRSYDPAAFRESPIPLPPGIRLAVGSVSPSADHSTSNPSPADQVPALALDVLPGEDLAAPPEPAAIVVTEDAPLDGGALGRIVIPAAGVDRAIVEGVDPADLRMGPGHMPQTALPGEPGNAVISGHRATYGAPFADLDRLHPGDTITVETATGVHTYAVVEVRIVRPSDTWVVEQWRGGWLTLTTCNPRFSSAERLVVFAHLVAGPNAGVILASS